MWYNIFSAWLLDIRISTCFCVDLYLDEPPMHSKVLEWRRTLCYLARFTKQCDQIVLNLLENLVIFGLKDLLECCEIPSVVANSDLYHKQLQKLCSMREQILSKPNTTVVQSRYGSYEDNDDPIPVADFDRICFDFPIQNELSVAVSCHRYDLPFEQTNELVSLWKADLKCVNENSKNIIKIVPSLDDFCSAVSKTISGFYKAVSHFTSLTSQDELVPYITHTKYDLVVDGIDSVLPWPNVAEMKHKNDHYELIIHSLLRNIFKNSVELIKVHMYVLLYVI